MTLHSVPAAQGLNDVQRLAMGQLAPDGLSEQWLLRDGGDRHWMLIARALGQDRAVFRDPAGRAVYAAFCATSVALAPPAAPLLGADAQIRSDLSRVSGACLASDHRYMVAGREVARLRMISIFVSHDETGSNRRVRRNDLIDAGCVLPPAHAGLRALHDRARAVAQACRGRGLSGGAAVLEATPVPSLDFNAAGLMYFPTYSRLAEMAEGQAAGGPLAPLAGREMVYMGNLDPGEGVRLAFAGADLLIARADGTVICASRSRRRTDPR